MASPPPPQSSSTATSPHGSSPLAQPRQRPTLALPGQAKSRKPSVASTTSSAHPLRQTSFPPAETLEAQHAAAHDATLRFSPSQASQGSLEDEFSDTEINSAIAGGPEEGPTRKRKRGEKRTRGRPAKHQGARTGSTSIVDGEDGHSSTKRGATRSAIITSENADDDDDADEDDEATAAGRPPVYDGGAMNEQDYSRREQQKNLFREYMDKLDSTSLTAPGRCGMTERDMAARYDCWNRSKLRVVDVRKLVNQTLSQSVPSNVVTVVSAYAKMFAGIIIEEAREVQGEWMAAEEKRADGSGNSAYERLRGISPDEHTQQDSDVQVNGDDTVAPASSPPATVPSQPAIKQESASSPSNNLDTQPESQPNASSSDTQQATQSPAQISKDTTKPEPLHPGGAGGLQTSIEECDRGPLQPDHLREALRRYKKARKGGTVGFTGLSLRGREVTASRMGGRRLFR